MTASLRVAIADDEPLARRRLRRLLAGVGGAEVVGEAADGLMVIELVRVAQPDVLLLDVQMPEIDGLRVISRLPAPRPLVVFVTAFDTFAVRAFDVNAVDYVMKPVSRERLAEALDRARARLAPGGSASRLATLGWLQRLPIRDQGLVRLIDVSTIDWIEAANNYVVVHAGRDAHVLRETLGSLERSLDPARFTRIHRSAMVSIDRVARLESETRGDYRVILLDGLALTMSRTYRPMFERAIGRRI